MTVEVRSFVNSIATEEKVTQLPIVINFSTSDTAFLAFVAQSMEAWFVLSTIVLKENDNYDEFDIHVDK